MELSLIYLHEGEVLSLPLRGTETMDEKVHIVSHGILSDMKRYGMQYKTENILYVNPEVSSVIRKVVEIPSDREILVSYITSILDMTERDIIAIADTGDMRFTEVLRSTGIRTMPTIDIYPILRTLSSIPHIPISSMVDKRSPYDKRNLSLVIPGMKGELLLLVDTLSLEGEKSLVGIRDMIVPGGIVIVIDTDYREDMTDLLLSKILVDSSVGSIECNKRHYKPRYQWHNILEKNGLMHMYTEYIDKRFNTYISAYTFLSDIHLSLERVYSIPRIMKPVSDIFPPLDKATPRVSINVNYDIDDLYSMDNPVYTDAHSIYTIIRKKSNMTPPVYIDGAGIGTMPLSFSKYTHMTLKTDKISTTLNNLALYRKGKITRDTNYIVRSGKREIVIGVSPPILPGSVVITTDPHAKYENILYKIVRTDLGTRGMEGERHDLVAETVYVVESGNHFYPEREMLRLVLIEKIYNTFAILVTRGDFRRYLFDILTIGRDVLLDPVIPVTSTVIVPESLLDMVNTPISNWVSFVELVRKEYPSYWDTNSKEIMSVLPFQTDKKTGIMNRFRDFISVNIRDTIGISLYNYIHEQFRIYNDSIGKSIGVHIDVSDNTMKISPNTQLGEIIGKRILSFRVTPVMLEGRSYSDIASMLLRHHILDGAGTPTTIDAIEVFGSPLSHMSRWRSIYPDIDTIWGSSGSFNDVVEDTVYFNPPYWNEHMSLLLSKMGDKKVYIPREYTDKVRGMSVILI